MNNEYPIFMQKIAPKSDFLYVQCTMYDVRLMYYFVLGTIYNRMTLDKIKYQISNIKCPLSIINYQLSKYFATNIIRSSMCLEWGTPRTHAPHLLLILATGNYSVRLISLHAYRITAFFSQSHVEDLQIMHKHMSYQMAEYARSAVDG